MIWLLIGYMWLFVHRPFEVWPWLGEYRIERVYMIVILVCWAFFAKKSWPRWRSNVPALLLGTTFLIAVPLSPHATFAYVEDWFKVFVFYVLLATSVRSLKDLKTLVIAYVAIVTLYELHSLWEYFHGRHSYEMGTKRMIGIDASREHPNSFGATVDYSLPFLLPAWTYAKARWQKLTLLGCLLLALTCVVLTGSRSSLAGVALIAIVPLFVSKHRWRVLGGLAVATPLVWVSLRSDLQDRYLTLLEPERGPANAQVSAESRSMSFKHGMRSFAQNPLTGSGLGSYRAETGMGTHNVYHQAMGELGVMGLAVLVGFAWVFMQNLRQAGAAIGRAPDPDELFLHRVCLAAAMSGLLLFFLGWGAHNLMRYNWLWFGGFSSCAAVLLVQTRAFRTVSSSQPRRPRPEAFRRLPTSPLNQDTLPPSTEQQ